MQLNTSAADSSREQSPKEPFWTKEIIKWPEARPLIYFLGPLVLIFLLAIIRSGIEQKIPGQEEIWEENRRWHLYTKCVDTTKDKTACWIAIHLPNIE